MSDEDLIVPSGIPQFIGNLGTLETDTKSLTADAKLFRSSGAAVHSSFQGLSACYKAPEAEKLFATTKPVETKSDAFADDLEKVASALSSYASTVKPLATKLGNLKDEAIAFVQSVEGDDHWRRDKKKVEHNNNLWHSVNATVAAFHDAERACHDKIVALVNGTPLIPDDGTHKPNMYGYRASDLDHAEKTPWGSMADREYTGLAWLGHQVKSFVWDGFIVDGVWGTVKGLGTLVGTEGWDKAGQAWTGLGKLATGLLISSTPLAGLYWTLPDNKLPSWVRDSRTTVKEAGKALVAYDQWGKNPARAAGGVTFNVLTTVFTGGSGAAAKGGALAKTASVLGKAGRIVDPMTYVGKAAKFGYVKVGDLLSGLKNLRAGSTVHIADEAFKIPGEAATSVLPKRPAGLPEDAVPFLDLKNNVVYLDKESGRFFNEHGKELQPPKKELSAEERAAEAARTPEEGPHSTTSDHEKVPVSAGARVGGDASASVGRGGEHAPGGAAGHAPGGAAHHIPGGGAGGRMPGGAAHDLGRGPSTSHEVPGTGGGNDGHTPTHSGGGGSGNNVPSTGHGGGTGPGAGESHVPAGPGHDLPSQPGHELPERPAHGAPGETGHESAQGHGSSTAGHSDPDDLARQHADDRPGDLKADHGEHGADNWGFYKGEEVHYAQSPLSESVKTLRFYEDMRDPFSSRGNVETIAEHTGMESSVIQTAKENLFLMRHDVETELGTTRKNVFFTPDELIADLWRKAEAGKLSDMEARTFRNHVAHEYVEKKLMELGMSYRNTDPRVWAGDSGYLSDKSLLGAHDVAPAALKATPLVSEGVGALSHWRSIGIEPPAAPILDDLSNVDELVEAVRKEFNL
ncbi:protein phosphatase [Streptomyces cinnamoneus]|uniref:protein phosphatase n=1 Tax=Streptomyces cinnamoneus TaxID=53446 RepID=UPI00341F3429